MSGRPVVGVTFDRLRFVALALAATAVLLLLAVAVGAQSASASADGSSGLNYTDSGTEVTVTGCTSTCPSPLVIPATINAHPVTAIGSNAFFLKGTVSSVTLPDGLLRIGSSAFQGTSISSIVLPTSLTAIDALAFSGTADLSGILIPASVTSVGLGAFSGGGLQNFSVEPGNVTYSDLGGVLYNKLGDWLVEYPPGRTATSFTVGSGTTGIGLSAFYWSNLTGVNLPDTLKSIDANAFAYMPKLTSITIPASVTQVGYAVFIGSGLADITVAAGNVAYQDIDGVLFSRDGSTLISYPLARIATTFAFPDGVTTISAAAFYGAKSLEEVEFPVTISSIGADAFAKTSNLTDVRFLGDPPTIARYAFNNSGGQNATNPFLYPAWRTAWIGHDPADGHPFNAVSGPVITTEPGDVTAAVGGHTQLTVAAADPWDKTYQWAHGADTLLGRTSPTLSLTNLQPSDAGIYRVTITNWAGQSISRQAVVTVTAQPPKPPTKKSNQSLVLKLKPMLKKKTAYVLPATTAQGTAVGWKVSGPAGCKIKGRTLTCTKSSGKKSIKLVAGARSTATLNAFTGTYTRKVK